ncbi:MAG: cytochrome c family protein [Nitrospirae bacterium]|nr:cytochrome c family protein [Nitrospirota bacterium]
MRYDSVAILKNELSFQDDLISAILKEHDIPVVSTAPQYRPNIALILDSLEVNVSADPKKHKKGKVNILLADMSVSEATLIDKWDVIILSSGEILETPLKLPKKIIVSGYPKGKKLGVLTLYFDGAGKIKDFKHRWQSLGNEIKEDAAVRSILNDYDSKVAMLLKESEKSITETAWGGLAKCAECHQPFAESWKNTRHARAFSSLEKTGKSANPECLQCHTVGFGEEGGFQSIASTPGLANVQCEVCHGAGREHLSDLSKPMRQITMTVCLKCHTKDSSPDFDFAEYLKRITH